MQASPAPSRIWLVVVLLLLAGLLGWLLTADFTQLGSVTKEARKQPKGGDFTLQSAQGPVSLTDFRGKVAAIFFGYTWCPDVCPTNLAIFSAALNRLTPEELARVQGIFVSVDPPRDSPERLAEYTHYFHDNLIGVTGAPEQVAEVAKSYGAAYRRVEQEGATGYTIDHTAETYLIAPDGKLAVTLQHATPPEKVAEALRGLLR